ncbi:MULTISPECIES: sigma-70 family RNA polymerase sigma factor [unclassified Luteimonas]|uniref:RNA polymerase sigma factor n=2 Tax=Lysobacteraceae TaxID=32033 RepID=UPI001E5FCDF6|nr:MULTISPECIES: sigma-70 family RNA polymerase sigma factor [unclassified Luteimonas]MCD9046116.1 sigma-70 family RNA polymerase sigma factor [Luteimonas sp. MHLX1A]
MDMACALPIDELISRELPAAARGDAHAYGRIVAASQNTVTAVALAITRDVATSEDIAQEAFLSAWRHLPRLQNPSSFLPWLRQITRNLARDHLRANRNRPLDGEAAELAIARAADPEQCPAGRLLDQERDAIAAELISELPEDSREVLLLYYREGQNSKQVAALLGLSDAAVRKRLSRARRCLRTELLERFRDFANGSAPATTFAVAVTAALGGISKPAAAAGMATTGSTIAGGLAGKLVFGTAGAVASGMLSGVLTAWLFRRVLTRYADNATERRAILRAYDTYLLTALACGFLVGVTWLAETRILMYAAIGASFVVLNYIMLVPVPRVMNPLVQRDAQRNPRNAYWRTLGYRLSMGPSGLLISNLVVAGILAMYYMQG